MKIQINDSVGATTVRDNEYRAGKVAGIVTDNTIYNLTMEELNDMIFALEAIKEKALTKTPPNGTIP